MNEKIESLKELIEQSELTIQQKINKIIQTLQRTEDPIKARMLSEQILNGEFGDLEEQSIIDMINAFSNENNNKSIVTNDKVEETKDNEQIYDEKDDSDTKNMKTLEYQIKVLQSQLESSEYNNNKTIKELELSSNLAIKELEESNNKRIKELEQTNNKLMSRLSLTKNSKLIEVSDESINELYIRNLETAATEYKEAFIIKGIVPKTYYKINNNEEK